ncbi:MAG TPA: hypothetical protein VMG10_23585 [Gemmataceae bacterium]|nr:hypothetical protein [Gemmataceae bacterium]
MRRCYPRLAGVGAVLLGLACLLSPLSSAEEAWRSDGQRLLGNLTLDDGQLRFQPTKGAALTPTKLTRIRFAEGRPTPFRAGGGRRVRLWDGEQITGQILELNKETLRLRTAWAARLELPRDAVASIEPLPGWQTILDENFRNDLKAFTMTGNPARTDAEDGTAAKALVLRASGQSLTYSLKNALSAGRVGVNFREQGKASGARWTMELLFQQGESARRVTVTFAGDGEHYRVDAGELAGTARMVARTPGWHRLIVQFRKQSLRLTCDEDVLWYNLEDGPGGRLRRVTIACQRVPENETLRGAVAWTELCIERAVVEHPPPPAETDQDTVRLLDDDQLFGRILHADRRAIQIEGRFGKRSLPWTMVSGCSFRRPAAPPNASKGAKVRLLLRSGLCPEYDVLEGVVTALDKRHLVLQHALLGELKFERSRLRELRPLAGSN